MKNKNQIVITKTAGTLFILCFILPTLNWVFIMSGFVTNNPVTTSENILANEKLFRYGLSIELLMAVGLVVLGAIIYSILKKTNIVLAQTALSLKIVEAALSSGIVLTSFMALYTQNDAIGILACNHKALFAVPMFFLGIDMTIFCYLFLKSELVPKAMSIFGMFSFILIFIHSTMFLVAPQIASLSATQAIFYTPSGLFELIIGTWLLTKGLKNYEQHQD